MTSRPPSRVLLAVVGCGLIAGSMAAQKLEVESNRDPNVDFAALRTYSWLPSPPLRRATAPEGLTNPDLSQEVLGPHIAAAVDRELTSRGLKRLDEGETDVRVVYYAALSVGMNAEVLGSYYQYTTGWALPLPPSTTSLRIFERGSIVVDVVGRSSNKAVWRGSIASDVAQQRSLEKRIERINEAIKKVFERFPLPAGKR